jgi:hypothetical protein
VMSLLDSSRVSFRPRRITHRPESDAGILNLESSVAFRSARRVTFNARPDLNY